MTNKKIRKITEKIRKREEKELKREIKSLIKTLKADIKRTAKKGYSEFHIKNRNNETYKEAKLYFISKGFRCWEYKMQEEKYLAIAW